MIQQARFSFSNLLFFALGVFVVVMYTVSRPLIKTVVSNITFSSPSSETSIIAPIPPDQIVGK